MNIKEGVEFLILMIAALSMDSDKQIIPGIIVIAALVIMRRQALKT